MSRLMQTASPVASLASITAQIRRAPVLRHWGRVAGVRGALIAVEGLGAQAAIGTRIEIGDQLLAEVTALDKGQALCLPFGSAQGLHAGMAVRVADGGSDLYPCHSWLGRVVDGLGRPMDGLGFMPSGLRGYAPRARPPMATQRALLGPRQATGVRALDVFAPVCEGQRLGLFAGSGVGKSVLLAMLARGLDCDVAVIGLIGERGREVQEFISRELGKAGLARSVLVVATSDEPALIRRQAAYTTLALAEYFRDCGARVLCLMDSVTRFAMAGREIGLAVGEPPSSKGYTPSVFAELPALLERAGPGLAVAGDGANGQGSITGLFTVLVDGDDHDEPIADAARGILDGHIVLTRAIAERGRFPAIDVLKSVSRSLPGALSADENVVRLAARALLFRHDALAELAQLGAYQAGSDAEADRALAIGPAVDRWLAQQPGEHATPSTSFSALADLMERAA